MRQDDDEFDPSADPRATPSDEFVGLGSFGYSSGEMPAVVADEQQRMFGQQRLTWARQRQAEIARQAQWRKRQRDTEECHERVALARRQGKISDDIYDFLQTEFEKGLMPNVYWDKPSQRWLVWSAFERQLYTVERFEAHLKEMQAQHRAYQERLPVDHPERETMELPILTPELLWDERQWPAAYDSELARRWGAPEPRVRPTPLLQNSRTTTHNRKEK